MDTAVQQESQTMPLHLTWEQIAIRLVLASVASFVIGLNRNERGHPAGIRTTMLVCLAATLAMLQVNLLLPLAGRHPSSFVMNDLMRLPLGILSGIGFIGAGVIIKKGGSISGVTTAATIWYVTVLGLLFGGGNIYLGIAGSLIAIVVLWFLKYMEGYIPREFRGSLCLDFSSNAPSEDILRQRLLGSRCKIAHWKAVYSPAAELTSIECDLNWTASGSRVPETPAAIEQLRALPGIRSLTWKE
jgi:putative Mg2+ transporter-C (MgtC) family protein